MNSFSHQTVEKCQYTSRLEKKCNSKRRKIYDSHAFIQKERRKK